MAKTGTTTEDALYGCTEKESVQSRLTLLREFSAHGLMVIDQIEGKQSRPTLLNLDSGL